jgi:hypothetical protein
VLVLGNEARLPPRPEEEQAGKGARSEKSRRNRAREVQKAPEKTDTKPKAAEKPSG